MWAVDATYVLRCVCVHAFKVHVCKCVCMRVYGRCVEWIRWSYVDILKFLPSDGMFGCLAARPTFLRLSAAS